MYKERVCKIFDADPAKKGHKFLGIEVAGLDELEMLDRDSCLVVTIVFYSEIKKFLEEKGFRNIRFVYSLRDDCHVEWEKHYFIHPCFSQDQLNELEKVKNFLSDAKSKYVLEKIIEHRQNENFDYSDICSADKQYFPNITAFKISEDEVFLDVGAYNGDTLNCFNEFTKGRWKAIYCFEPDENNFLKLEMEAAKFHDVQCFQYGIGKKDDVLEFNSGMGISSSLLNDIGGKKSYIKIKAIDSLAICPTYIKMDVEGAELEALQGAEQTIKKYRPKLAISIYHRANDLWQIPLYIKKLVPEYNLYLDHYSDGRCESVIYATV